MKPKNHKTYILIRPLLFALAVLIALSAALSSCGGKKDDPDNSGDNSHEGSSDTGNTENSQEENTNNDIHINIPGPGGDGNVDIGNGDGGGNGSDGADQAEPQTKDQLYINEELAIKIKAAVMNDEELEQKVIATASLISSYPLDSITADSLGLRVYGVFESACVFLPYISGMPVTDTRQTEEAGGVTFSSNEKRALTVFANDSVMELKEAYEKELISRDELKILAATCSAGVSSDYWMSHATLSPQTEKQLTISENLAVAIKKEFKAKRGYENKHIDDIYITVCGVFDSTCVVIVEVKGEAIPEGPLTESAAGINFVHSDGNHFEVFRGGDLTSLREGYLRGHLDLDQLKILEKTHNAGIRCDYWKKNVAIPSQTVNQLTVSDQTALAIKSDLLATREYGSKTPEDVTLRIYGAFNGAYVFLADIKGYSFSLRQTEETVGGVTFTHPKRQFFEVWCDGTVYRTKEAFDLGILTVDDLKTLGRTYENNIFFS